MATIKYVITFRLKLNIEVIQIDVFVFFTGELENR